jgi:hypothetical protein
MLAAVPVWAAIALFAGWAFMPPRGYEGPRSAEAPDVETPRPVVEQPDASETEAPARARLRGRVLRFGDRDPIVGARIVRSDGGESVDTDDDGSFSVFLAPGTHRLKIRAPGFETLDSEITLKANEDLEIEYRLDPELGASRYRTVVKHEREVAVSSTRLREEEIYSVPGTRGDPLRVVSSLPGASQLAGFLPYVVVRGAAPGNTGYYLDGTRVPILFHVAIGPSVIHPQFIDAVDFYPAGAPVRLGRFVGGIVEARTRPARRDRVHGEVDLRLTDAGGLLEIPFNRPLLPGCTLDKRRKCPRGNARGSLTVAGRYSYTAAILSLVQSEARIRYWDYQARLDHALGPRADFTSFFYGSFDDIGEKPYVDMATGERVVPNPWLRFQFHRIDNRIRQRLRRGGSATYAVVLGLDQSGLDAVRTNEWRVAPRADLIMPINEVVSLGFGLDQEFQIFRLREPLEDTVSDNLESYALLFSDRFVSVTGLYLEALVSKGNFEARPGVRADVYTQVGASPYLPNASSITHAVGVDPRLALRERLTPRWTLRQAVGVYHQPPSFPVPIPGIESFGFDRGLQRNIQGSFGYEVRLVEGLLHLVQDAYLGRLTNLQDYELSAFEDDIDDLEDVISQVSGWAYGIETMLRLDPGLRMYGWAAYTLSRSTRNYRLGGRAPSDWDQRHILNVVLGYRISHKWTIGTRVHYHTGRPWTAPFEGQTQLEAFAQNRNNARLPAFFQLDLLVERTWRWANWQLQAFLDIANSTYSREIFACNPEGEEELGLFRQALAAQLSPSRGIARCAPQGFRYIIPSLGMRGRF